MKEKQPYEKPKMTFIEKQSERSKMKQENMAMEQIYRDTLGVRYL